MDYFEEKEARRKEYYVHFREQPTRKEWMLYLLKNIGKALLVIGPIAMLIWGLVANLSSIIICGIAALIIGLSVRFW